MMDAKLIQIRDQQKEIWNRYAGGWKKWDEFTMHFLKPMGDAIIKALEVQQTDKVLDIACGTGEPGLTIAGIANKGSVIGIDLSEEMLEVANEHAISKQIKNYDTKVCDVCELPFADDFFDKVSCRMGFMFFPDMQLAANEIYRVLKTEGKIATSVWGVAERNIWVTSVTDVINRKMQLTGTLPGEPSMFRCASVGVMKGIFEAAGFANIKVSELNGIRIYKDFDHLWEMMNDVAAPVVGAMVKASNEMKQNIKTEVKQLTQQYQTTEGLELEFSSLIFSCEK